MSERSLVLLVPINLPFIIVLQPVYDLALRLANFDMLYLRNSITLLSRLCFFAEGVEASAIYSRPDRSLRGKRRTTRSACVLPSLQVS
jgi:hypothetical protein